MSQQASILKKNERVPSDEELIESFIEDCRLKRLTPESIRSYESNLKIVSKFLSRNGLSLLDLDKMSLRRVLKYLLEVRGVSTSTLNGYFSALSSLFKYLIYEGVVENNPVLPFRERYLRDYKNQRNFSMSKRKIISVQEMAQLINSILDTRDKAIITLLAKTGIRRRELIDIDIDDIDWIEQSIRLKPKAKRNNSTVFFDGECARVIKRWLRGRKNYDIDPDCRALFVGEYGGRLKRHGVYDAVKKHAERLGLHDSNSKKIEDHFTPHCCRHWFTTHLRRNGMKREFIKELRGDSRNEAMDIYYHIDRDELRRSYLANIPMLGID